MDTLLTITALCGLLSTGFVIGDYLTRRRTERELQLNHAKLGETLAAINTTHNQLVLAQQDMADRLGAVEMSVRGVKR